MSEPYSHISEEDIEVHRGGPVGPWDSLSSSSLLPHQAAWLGDTRKVFKRGDAKVCDKVHKHELCAYPLSSYRTSSKRYR